MVAGVKNVNSKIAKRTRKLAKSLGIDEQTMKVWVETQLAMGAEMGVVEATAAMNLDDLKRRESRRAALDFIARARGIENARRFIREHRERMTADVEEREAALAGALQQAADDVRAEGWTPPVPLGASDSENEPVRL